MDTSIRIYQGNQIGGCVTVITHIDNDGNTSRIMIDYGSSLPGSDTKKDFDYPWESEPVDAVLFTHYHGDHVGRISEIPTNIPLYMGATAREVMMNIHDALRKHGDDKEMHQEIYDLLQDEDRVHVFEIEDRHYKAINIKDLSIEPYSVDHSAYDAYMFLVESPDDTKESGKKVILHTGDFRGHGRRGKAMIPVIKSYVHAGGRKVDVLIIEGTMMSRLGEEVKTESQMQQEATEFLEKHKYAFLICSSTNLDSLASFYQGYKRANNLRQGYMYVYSEYYKTQLETFDKYAGRYSGAYKFKNINRLFLNKPLSSKYWNGEKTQRELMDEKGFIATIKPEEFCEQYIDAFIEDYRAGIIDQMPVIIYSMWDGYIKDTEDNKAKNEQWIQFLDRQKRKGVIVEQMHTSGHASAKMLSNVIKAVNPQERIIPMHTEHPEEFANLEIGEVLRRRLNSMKGYYKRGKDDKNLYELVKKDTKLMKCISGDKSKDYFVGIRDNSISLYYNGVSAASISVKDGGLEYKTHKKYITGKDKDSGYPTNSLDLFWGEEEKIKDNIDKINLEHNKLERVCQQKIILANNSDSNAEWYFVDMEYTMSHFPSGRFDMIAIKKEPDNGKHQVALIELKVGDGAIGGSPNKYKEKETRFDEVSNRLNAVYKSENADLKYGSGIVGHIVDYMRYLYAGFYDTLLKEEIALSLERQAELGIETYLQGITANDLSDKPDVYIVCYDNVPKDKAFFIEKPNTLEYIQQKLCRYMYDETVAGVECSTHCLEKKVYSDDIQGFLDKKSEMIKCDKNEYTVIQKIPGKGDYNFFFKYIDSKSDNCWNFLN